jgi:membrane peptidoglycan carboxypeptidase
VISVMSGVLVAGIALPVVGGVGLVAKDSAEGFQALPAELRIPALSQRSTILAADGSVIASFYEENRTVVPISEVAPVMRRAVIAIEDARFYKHGGIDLRGTMRAFINNQTGEDVQGGSTLTQQYVKQVLVQKAQRIKDKAKRLAAMEAATEQSYSRKLRELRYAVAVEEQYTKKQILERYLNIAYFGASSYGVEAAAKRYFRTTARELTLEQAALLAGIVQQPTAFNPILNPERAIQRRNVVLTRMEETGLASPAEVAAAKAKPLELKVQKKLGNSCEESRVPFFCDFVLKTILKDEVFGKTKADRRNLLLRGGLTITTTLDWKVQKAAQEALREYVSPKDEVASALATVEPGSGHIRAIAVSKRYGTGKHKIQFNPATDRAYGGSSGFQAGSTFKVFVAAAALEMGLPFSYGIYSPYKEEIEDIKGCGDEMFYEEWEPQNELTSENGYYTLETGMEGSINTYFAQLEEVTGVCRPWEIATALGVDRADGKPLQRVKSFTLGVNEVSPLTMAEAYATFAARGVHCNSVAILEVTDPTGKRLPVPDPACEQAIDPEIADGMNELLQGVMTQGTGVRAQIGRPAAGKTGTTNRRVSVWFIGYTPELSTAVWAGNPSPPADGYPLQGRVIGGRYYGDVCGGCLPGPIWRMMMSEALADTPVSDFNDVTNEVRQGDALQVPDLTGQSVEQAQQALRDAGFDPVVNGTPVNVDYAAAGTVAYTFPNRGEGAYAGQRVVIYISAGPAPVAPQPEPQPTLGDPGGGDGNGNNGNGNGNGNGGDNGNGNGGGGGD